MMPPRHQQLFEEYVHDLQSVAPEARASFASAVRQEQLLRQLSQSAAEAAVRKTKGPPAAHPRVLGTISAYFFSCQYLNEQSERRGLDEVVYPLVFVHEMLSGRHQDLWEFLSELDYLPVGLLQDDTWV